MITNVSECSSLDKAGENFDQQSHWFAQCDCAQFGQILQIISQIPAPIFCIGHTLQYSYYDQSYRKIACALDNVTCSAETLTSILFTVWICFTDRLTFWDASIWIDLLIFSFSRTFFLLSYQWLSLYCNQLLVRARILNSIIIIHKIK